MNCESFENSGTALLLGPKVLVGWALTCLFVVSGQPVWGQESPFGESGAPDSPPAVVASGAMTGGAMTGGAITGGATTGDEAADGDTTEVSEFDKLLAAETDPLVRAILAAQPTTPDQWIHDVQALLNLKRLGFVHEYLKQFLTLKPGDPELAQIQTRYGSALFLRLSTLVELQPEGAAVAEAVTKAASDRLHNKTRLSALVDRLNDPDPAARRLVLVELVKSGSAAAVPLIAALGDADRSGEHAAVRTALIALGNEAVAPLIATLHTGNQALQLQAIAILGDLKSLQAVPLVLRTALAPGQDPAAAEAAGKMLHDVLGDVPSPNEAISFLKRRLANYLTGATPGPIDQDDQVTVWIWDATQQIPRQQTIAAADAAFLAAAVVAEQLHRMDVSNSEFTLDYLATNLEVAKRLNGYNRPLTEEMGTIYQEATAADTDVLESVLQLAFEKKMPGAAIAAIDLLGQSKRVELLQSDDGQPRLLAKALIHPVARVKFAAAQAVMNINPIHAYPGSSYIPEVLGYLAVSAGERRVLIGNPRTEDAQQLAGFYNVLGFTVDSQPTGRNLVLQAVTNPDYSFVLVYGTIDRPRYREVIQMLRRDPRTADLPVGLMVGENDAEAAKLFAKTDPLTLALAPPQTQQDVALDTRRLLTVAGRAQVSPDERIHQALFALDALAQLATEPEKYTFYNLLPLDERMEHALSVPRLAAKAAGVLGLLGTPRAQRALVGFASTEMQPLPDRLAAATAFRTAVSRRGLLLTRDQLLRQYDQYNTSESLAEGTQQVLGSILDAIEAPSQTSNSTQNDD